MTAQDNVRGFRIKPEVELMAWAGGEFRIGGLRIKAPTHEINSLCQLGEMRIDG
jgi:hypothetical protein